MISLLRSRQRTTPIGLDMGECGVRAAQMTRSADSYRVRQMTCADRQAEVADEHPHTDRDTWLGGRIHSCLGREDYRGRVVATALSAPDVEFHALELPKTGPAELTKIVRHEVRRLFTRKDDQVQTGYWTLPHTEGSTPNAMGVVAPYNRIVDVVELCRREGLICSRVDTGATSLSRFGSLLGTWESDELWGVLDLGYRQSRLVLCLEDVPVLVRAVGAGGEVWTRRIAEGLGTTTKTAEVQKRDHGIALAGRTAGVDGGSTAGGHRAEERRERRSDTRAELAYVLLGILRSDLNGLAAEVKRSYEYVLSCYPGRRASDLILVGGGACTQNLPEYLTGALGIRVRRASSYLQDDRCRIRCDADGPSPLETMALAIGLAIGG